jgi:effector-binding domain-containing protein
MIPYDIVETEFGPQNFLAAPKQLMNVAEITEYFMKWFPALAAEAKNQQLHLNGQPSGFYSLWDEATHTTEVQAVMPVQDPALENGEFTVIGLPATKVLRASYYGPYEGTSAAHAALDKFIRENSYTITGNPWETYVTDPAEEPDPASWLTEVYYPVA